MLERTSLTDLQEGFAGYDGYEGFEGVVMSLSYSSIIIYIGQMSRGSLEKTEKTFGIKNAGRFLTPCQPLSVTSNHESRKEYPSDG